MLHYGIKKKNTLLFTFMFHRLMILLLPLSAILSLVIVQEASALTGQNIICTPRASLSSSFAPAPPTSFLNIQHDPALQVPSFAANKRCSFLSMTIQNTDDSSDTCDEQHNNPHSSDRIHTSGSTTTPPSSETPGDKIRESTGKRPSLDPTIINTLSEALSFRSSNDTKFPMEVSPTAQALDVAIAAGKLATKAIEKRAMSSKAVKGDESSAFTPEESQLIAGRVVGVVMRWKELEEVLIQRVKDSSWVLKYGEESSFGVLKEECQLQGNGSEMESKGDEVDFMVKKKLRGDPLLRMCRAECLYALFINNVESPALKKLGQVSQDGMGVDFLDKDRISVLFPDDR